MAVRREGFRRALKAAVQGPDIKDVEWTTFGHDFNVKKAVVTKTAQGLTIDGGDGHHISHRLRFRPDDQVFYKCRVTRTGQVEGLEISVKSSTDILKEWFKTAGEILTIVGAIIAAAKSDGVTDLLANAEPASGSEELLDGEWRGDVEFMIANIIYFVTAREMPDVVNQSVSPGAPQRLVNPGLIAAFADARDRLAGAGS